MRILVTDKCTHFYWLAMFLETDQIVPDMRDLKTTKSKKSVLFFLYYIVCITDFPQFKFSLVEKF